MKLLLLVVIFISGCAMTQQGVNWEKKGVQNFCIETTCKQLENSGARYQNVQQGNFN